MKFMGRVKEFIISWILPRDKRTLHDWLAAIEIFNVVLSALILIILVLVLTVGEILWTIKFGVVLLMCVIGLSTLNIMQYLLAIEFNSRKVDILKKRINR